MEVDKVGTSDDGEVELTASSIEAMDYESIEIGQDSKAMARFSYQ